MFKILLVEDDPMVAKFHEHYISQVKGFELTDKVRNGEDALDLMCKKRYDLILLDIFMPNMDGLELLRKIREQNIDVDVIVVSAARDNERIQFALREGAIDYVIKPFEFERFNLALKNFLHRRNLLEGKKELEQEELDSSILYKECASDLSIPKGLDRNTLKSVWQDICQLEDVFTTEELAIKVGISRVSIRKYLDFLKTLKVLTLELHRGSVGRPVYKYKCIDKSTVTISHYLNN